MNTLQGVKVGDDVIVTDVNRRGSQRAKVTAIGRKYATIGRDKYDFATGQWADRDFGSHRYAYTLAAWARRETERAFCDALGDLNGIRQIGEHVTDAELQAATKALQDIAATLRGPQ